METLIQEQIEIIEILQREVRYSIQSGEYPEKAQALRCACESLMHLMTSKQYSDLTAGSTLAAAQQIYDLAASKFKDLGK